MIIGIILILGSFIWLLHEADFLRIRLPIGLEPTPIKYQYKTWEELKPYYPNKQYPFWVRFPEYMSPLCGWQYVIETMHIIPETRVELCFGNGYKQTFTLKKPELMRQIIKINCGKKYFKQLASA